MSRDLVRARDTAVSLAVEVGRLQVEQRSNVTGLETKAHANDLVSHVDIASEKRIVEGLLGSWPDDGILGEEGNRRPGASGWRWVIDPLDGTRNYLTAAGPWSVSIALQHGEDTVVGVVHDPALGETFSAIKGFGPLLNGAPVGVSRQSSLAEAIVGLSFDPSPQTKIRMADAVSALLPVIGDIRRVPSALGLSYLASGRFDCCLLIDTQLWDIAAAELIASESKAVLGSTAGNRPNELMLGAGSQVWAEYVASLAPILGAVTPFTALKLQGP